MKPESHKSLRQFVRYIMVGGFNAVFGYSVFALLTWSFRGLGSYNYMYAAILGNVIAISAAFLGYKWFVFRTRGNYLVEWIRCFGVYGSSALIGLAGLPILVPILRHILHKPERAPYIAGAALMMVTVVFSFLGHKNISFRQKLVRPAAQSGVESLTLGRAGTTTVVHDSKKEFGDGLPTSLPFWDPRKALEYPPIYNLFQRAVGADKPRRAFIAEHIAPLGRARVLEVGCGPATNCAWMPREIEYVGCDHSKSYIEYARQRYGDRAEFYSVPVGQLRDLGLKPFKAVIALALLHHLNDAEVLVLCDEVLPLLETGGTLITADPCFVVGMGRLERFITSCDRGRYVRYPEQYRELLARRFPIVNMIVRRSRGTLIPNTGVTIKASLS